MDKSVLLANLSPNLLLLLADYLSSKGLELFISIDELMLTQSTRLLDLGHSQMGSELMKKMLDYTISSKSDRTTEAADLAELNPLEMYFTWETGLQVANILMFVQTGKYLSNLETIVFYGAWNDYTYQKMADITGYGQGHLCGTIGPELWSNLSLALKVKVSKKNFKSALKIKWQQYTQAILSHRRNRLAKLPTTENMTFESWLALGSTFYLERPPIERICYEAISKPGSLIRIEGARWMGKTALVEQILERANSHTQRTVYVDFSSIDRKIIQDIDMLLRWLLLTISFQLNLEDKVKHYYQKSALDWSNNCTNYFEKYILNEIESDLILALDDIDYLFFNKETTEEFLKLLSNWHEKGQDKGCWSKLRLIFTQSTNADISTNVDSSLLEMGTPIVLKEFSFDQVKTIANLHRLDWDDFTIRRSINGGGHPYFVRQAMYQTWFASFLDSEVTIVI